MHRFSISKWIHLNRGDEGILTFFRRVHDVLPVGGTFVLEPQEWDTYAKAKRMDTVRCLYVLPQLSYRREAQKLRENAASLKLRPGDVNHELQEIGFSPADHLGAVGVGGKSSLGDFISSIEFVSMRTGFRRPVDLYVKLK